MEGLPICVICYVVVLFQLYEDGCLIVVVEGLLFECDGSIVGGKCLLEVLLLVVFVSLEFVDFAVVVLFFFHFK